MEIQELMQYASESIQESGTLMPMIHLQLSTDYILIALDILDDSQSIPVQCGILARLAWEECKKYPGQTPVSIGFTTEAWMSTAPQGHGTRMRPVSDPHKREVVVVEHWQEGNHELYYLPIIRSDTQGRATLGPAEGPRSQVSYQFEAFLLGAKDAQRPYKEMFAALEEKIACQMKNLSPEATLILEKFLDDELGGRGE